MPSGTGRTAALKRGPDSQDRTSSGHASTPRSNAMLSGPKWEASSTSSRSSTPQATGRLQEAGKRRTTRLNAARPVTPSAR